MTTVLAPLRMDARVWFANERTFLSWMNMSAILTTFAGGLTVIGEGYATQITGVLILTSSALIFILYAAYMHYLDWLQEEDVTAGNSGIDFRLFRIH